MENTARKITGKEAWSEKFLAYLPVDIYERLRLQAFKEKKSMSAVVREALALYFEKH